MQHNCYEMVYFHFIAYITPVMSPYRVTEEQTNAHVCFVLNNSLPSTLELSVSTIDGTALGKLYYIAKTKCYITAKDL